MRRVELQWKNEKTRTTGRIFLFYKIALLNKCPKIYVLEEYFFGLFLVI